MSDNVEVLMMRTETLAAHLRKLAMRAELGELRSAIFGFVDKNSAVATSWWIQPGSKDSLLLIAASNIVLHEFMALVMQEHNNEQGT